VPLEKPPTKRSRPRLDNVPTLADVARAAGVSTATVSRAIARPELVSDGKRDQVTKAVHDLEYMPNAAARALSRRRSMLMGLVAGSMDDVVVVSAIGSFARQLADAGCGLLLATCNGSAEDARRHAGDLIARGADALAFVGVEFPSDVGGPGHAWRRPLASIDQAAAGAGFTGFSRAEALQLAVRYLRELGHRCIGLVAGGPGCAASVVSAMVASEGIDLVELPNTMDEGGKIASGSDGLVQCLSRPIPPTAVVCGSDAVAAAILRECDAREIAVPGRLAVIGFGDTEIARQTRPGLSTLRLPAREAAIVAANYLMGALGGEAVPARALHTKLVVRDSTRPPST
jgi:LacI family transcriptional regulator, galactose operon repressor